MISDWTINLDEHSAQHVSGSIIRLLPDTYEKKGEWIYDEGVDANLLNEGIACYDHKYSKTFLSYYLEKYQLNIEEVAEISNKCIDEREIKVPYISSLQLEKFMADEDFFPISIISIIRTAVYFYKKKFGLEH